MGMVFGRMGGGIGMGSIAIAATNAIIPGVERPTFTTTPTVLYHPNTETGVALSGSEITAVTGEEQNLSTTSGPDEVTDALGRKFWRFDTDEFLEIPNTYTFNPQAFTILMVVRVHRVLTDIYLLGQTYRDAEPPTLDTTFAPMFGISGTQSTGHLRTQRVVSDSTHMRDMTVGSQLAVVGVSFQGTNARFYYNGKEVDALSHYFSVTMAGARIGGYKTLVAGGFDVYACALFNGSLSAAAADNLRDELMDHFGIVDNTRDLVLTGDSLTSAFGVENWETQSMYVSEPGAGLLPANVRVLNIATSGYSVDDLVTQAAYAKGIGILPTGTPANHVAVIHIGVNDMSPGVDNQSAATTYAELVAHINTASTGLLQRGLSVAVCVNIQTDTATLTDRIDDLRTLLRASQFLVDCDAGVGGTYEGQVSLIELPLIEYNSGTPFDGQPTTEGVDSGSGSPLFVDATHPNALGKQLIATGGDTPQYGLGSIF